MKTNTGLFKAGAAKVDITPPLGTQINGDFITHYAHTLHDPLYSKALVLENKNITIAFIVVDICHMRKDFIDEIKIKIRKQIGLPPENILISSTHTHAAGSIEEGLLSAANLPYRENLSGLIMLSVLKAKEKLISAKIAFGKAEAAEHVVCRRYFMKPGYKAYNPVTGGLDKIKTNPMGDEDKIDKREGKADTTVCYLAIQGIDGQWISLLANYSMHYVGDWENGTITADYFGVFARQMQARLHASEGFVAIMTNGTSGDANIVDFLQPDRYPKAYFEKSTLIGSDIAEKVITSMESLEWETTPSLSTHYNAIEIEVRKPSFIELQEAQKLVQNTRYEYLSLKNSADTGTSHTGNEDVFSRIYAREQIFLNTYPDTILFPVQVFKIGSVIIGGLGGEFFSETGIWLKKKSNVKNYFTICLANGYTGYVPPEHEFELGGYETWRCRGSYLAINAEDKIRNTLLNLIN